MTVLTIFILIVIPIQYRTITTITVAVLPYNIRSSIFFILHCTWQCNPESDRPRTEKKKIEKLLIYSQIKISQVIFFPNNDGLCVHVNDFENINGSHDFSFYLILILGRDGGLLDSVKQKFYIKNPEGKYLGLSPNSLKFF